MKPHEVSWKARLRQWLFVAALLTWCWYGMQAVHELGHVTAAWLAGTEVRQVVLHPLTISRTDLGNRNEYPLLVVWAGPICGALLPVAVMILIGTIGGPSATAQFFAGFCLIANGVYIGCGAFADVGDCRVMSQHGTPLLAMVLFGLPTVPVGLLLWDQLGSPREFFEHPEKASPKATLALSVTLVIYLVTTAILSPT